MKPEYSKTRVHLWVSLLRATSTKSNLSLSNSWRYWCSRFFDRCLLTHWRSPERSRSGVLGGGALSSNLAGVIPSFLLLAGVVGSSSVLPLLPGASLGACSGTGAVLGLLRPVVPHRLALLSSALGRFLDQ